MKFPRQRFRLPAVAPKTQSVLGGWTEPRRFWNICLNLCLEAAAGSPILELGRDVGQGGNAGIGSCRMASVSDWKVPASAQPKPEDYAYDLEAARNIPTS